MKFTYPGNFPSFYIKHVLLMCCLAVLWHTHNVKAEGSKELTANGGNRAYLYSSTIVNASFPFPTKGTMKVYVKPGETINVGCSAQGLSLGTINLRAPDGATYSSGSSITTGLIANRAQELAGPLPTPGGYTPFTKTVLTGQEGIWEVDFISPSGGADGAANPTPVAVDAAWAQFGGQYVTAFDVSVRNAANTQFLTGRVFTNEFIGILGRFNVGFNGIFNVLTKDGYQYSLDNNGQAGNGFTFFVNNKGFRDGANLPSYNSVNNVTNPNVQDPRASDTESDITYKIFFNTPAADLPAVANTVGGGTTWLLNTPIAAALSNFTFNKAVATGTVSSGKFAFNSTGSGAYLISIDANRNAIYTDAADRQLTGALFAGANEVTWDGLDGAGNKITAFSGAVYSAKITVTANAGEVHFPFFDVERNVNGLKLTRLNGSNAPDNTLYWDDTQITIVGKPSNPIKNLTGINSLTNGHTWGTATTNADNDADFGNNKSIDTWGYIISPPLTATTNLDLFDPKLETAVIAPNIFTPNNDGKNDVFQILGLEQYPGSQLNIFNRWGNAVYHSDNYTNDWNGSNLAEGTYFYILNKKEHNGSTTTTKGWVYLKR
ncbi:gliding motility-associated C-terminal domain-containing protein [Mucilaginibacter glaciei]|uniref:Gliding motility-associated C-terminal domain-containing protein n=1 Tax=Mucilaginibacter glaciei TaxID=2772109 RepID=A0A926NNB3_9SPHI|nr:gliding motility-associated C-terminal domain-containing protein [Mucilaginibacter glaciei]MBD1392042.1 gliding motility-associated C-terminal domain-containing protein [Mucilaginibacter glaciei]